MADDRRPGAGSRLARVLLLVAGTISLGLGILGVFVPVLPTTPFLLLAAACYFRSSPSLYSRLIDNPWLGRYIQDYREKRGVPRSTKVLAITMLWLTIGFSAAFATQVLAIRALLVAIALAVTTHLLMIPTSRR